MNRDPEDAREYASTLSGEDGYIFGRVVQEHIVLGYHKNGFIPEYIRW